MLSTTTVADCRNPERVPKSLLRWVLSCTLFFALLCAAGIVLVTLFGSIRFLRPGPGFDYWDAGMPFLKAAIDGPFQWHLLWEMYGGAYSLVFDRCMFWLEWWITDFRNTFTLAAEWLSLFGTGAVTMWAVWQDRHLDYQSRYLCLLLVLLACGSGQHMNNLSYTFNMPSLASVTFCLLFIVGVFHAATSNKKSVQVRNVVMAGLSAVLLATCIFSLPALLATWCALALGLRLRWKVSMLVAGLIVAATLIYSSGMPTPAIFKLHLVWSDEPHIEGAVTVWQLVSAMVLFFLQYAGAPLAEYSLTVAGWFSLVVMLGLSFFAWQQLRSAGKLQPLSLLVWLILGYAVYLLTLDFCTALGRVGSDTVVAPRYRSYITPYLMFAGIAAVYALQTCKDVWRTAGSICLIVLAFVVVLPAHHRLLNQFSKEYDDYVTPFVAMTLGLTHSDVVHQSRWGIWWAADNRQMLEYRDFLRDHGKAIYAEPYFLQVGQSVVLPTNVAADDKLDSIIERLPGGGYQWKSTTATCDSDGRIALVNEQGVIVGAGLVSRALPSKDWRVNFEVFRPLCSKSHPASWIAYLPVATRVGEMISAVSFDGGKPVLLARAAMP